MSSFASVLCTCVQWFAILYLFCMLVSFPKTQYGIPDILPRTTDMKLAARSPVQLMASQPLLLNGGMQLIQVRSIKATQCVMQNIWKSEIACVLGSKHFQAFCKRYGKILLGSISMLIPLPNVRSEFKFALLDNMDYHSKSLLMNISNM